VKWVLDVFLGGAKAMMQQFHHGYALFIGVGQTQYQPWSLPVTVILNIFIDEVVCSFFQYSAGTETNKCHNLSSFL
jgi:hypothetical protein